MFSRREKTHLIHHQLTAIRVGAFSKFPYGGPGWAHGPVESMNYRRRLITLLWGRRCVGKNRGTKAGGRSSSLGDIEANRGTVSDFSGEGDLLFPFGENWRGNSVGEKGRGGLPSYYHRDKGGLLKNKRHASAFTILVKSQEGKRKSGERIEWLKKNGGLFHWVRDITKRDTTWLEKEKGVLGRAVSVSLRLNPKEQSSRANGLFITYSGGGWAREGGDCVAFGREQEL